VPSRSAARAEVSKLTCWQGLIAWSADYGTAAEGEARDRQFAQIACRPAIARVLAEHGRPPEDVKRIANMLITEGVGFRIRSRLFRTRRCWPSTTD